uniref:dTMP kinase n=1 Tax=uncultured prokaryote TaxID=198431 RepID=H5SEJ9_9ZZZZ|nr:dTMP kinase [uncultured prokaryote]
MGRFITFEGIEGSGKSTQVGLLADALSKKGIRCIKTREPGGTPLGEKIREILLKTTSPIGPMTELLLYLSARAEHIRQVIIPALNSGIWVISDRYCDATLAYQGFGRGLDIAEISQMNKLVTGGLLPDLTFLLDIPAELGLKRAMERLRQKGGSPDRLESESLEFHRRVRDGYLRIAQMEPERIKVIDALDDEVEIHKKVMKHIELLISNA